MTFQEVITEGQSLIEQYKDDASSLTREEVQTYRDKLSYICSALAIFEADFYTDKIQTEIKRKVLESKEKDKLVESGLSVARSEVKVKINLEKEFKDEADADHIHHRAKVILDSYVLNLHSMASRLDRKNQS